VPPNQRILLETPSVNAHLPFVRLAGLVGIAATAAMVVADLVMLYIPSRGGGWRLQQLAAAVSPARLLIGDYLGVFVLPFVLVGLAHIYLGLRSAGPWWAVPPVALLTYTYILGAAFHHGMALLVRSAQVDLVAGMPLARAMDLTREFLAPLLVVFFAAALVGGLWLFLAIRTGRTAYPVWVAWLSPPVTTILFIGLQRLGPAQLAGALIPAGPNVAMLLFLSCSTVVLWH
jgi:hypothetical protein